MTSRPVVLHVTTTSTSLELLLGPQLRAFQDRGWTVETASAAGPEVRQLAKWGITHHALRHSTRAMAPHRDLLVMRELYSLFRRRRPNIVHTHNPKPGVYGRLAAKAARVPSIVNTVHGLYAQPSDPWTRRAVVYTLEAIAARVSDVELLQNVEDLAVLRRLGVPARKLSVLGNGIDLSRFQASALRREQVEDFRRRVGAAPGQLLVCSVGRLVWEKGFREIFAAARLLREWNLDFRWVVAGNADDGKPDTVTVEARAGAELTGMVFTGFVADTPLVYAASDLFVTASHREGFPRAAMEASAMGLPIVATDVRGCRQVVDDGLTGRLVPVRDPVSLAHAIADLAASPGQRAAMSAAAYAKAASEFDDKRIIDTTLGVYQELLRRQHAT